MFGTKNAGPPSKTKTMKTNDKPMATIEQLMKTNEKQMKTIEIYLKFNNKNQHKMSPIPVCEIPTSFLD